MSNNFTDILREKLLISDLIGSYIPITKKGNNYWACCPFHNEKTASFSINNEKGFYHCFGCGEHGDIISFFMKYKNIDFFTSIKELSKIAGINIPEYKKKSDYEINYEKKYFQLMKETSIIYNEQLFNKDGEKALLYLKNRGFNLEIIKKYNIGYAPNNNIITKKLINKNFIKETGLIKSNNLGNYDFFRDRLMFPIFDENNNIIAFSGRALNNQEPKYLNTVDTKLFHKKKILFGLNFAKNNIYKKNKSIIVEGQIDVIKMQNNGFEETIAPLGTAITENHINKLFKINKNLTFCFDGDEAGYKAAIRACSIVLNFINENSNIKFAFMPLNKDPDDILNQKDGKNILNNIINNSLNLIDFLWDVINKKFNTITPNGRTQAEKYLINEINKIKDKNYKYQINQELKQKMFNFWYKWKKNKTENNFYLNSIINNKLITIKQEYPNLYNKYIDILKDINIKEEKILNNKITLKEAEIFLNNLVLQKKLNTLFFKRKQILENIKNNEELNNINKEIENIKILLQNNN